MFKTLIEQLKASFIRMGIEAPALATPQFRATLLLAWVLAFSGLAYGRLFGHADSISLSLLLSGLSWFGAAFFVFLKNPWPRLRLFLAQAAAFALLTLLLLVMAITYGIFSVTNAIISIRIAWLGGTVVLFYMAVRSVMASFVRLSGLREELYPGIRTVPVLFFLFLLNGLWWLSTLAVQ